MRQRLQKAYQEPDADRAVQALEALAKELEQDHHPGAAGSLREGIAETLTVHRLGLPGLLRQTLATTNAMESINSRVDTQTLAPYVRYRLVTVFFPMWLVSGI